MTRSDLPLEVQAALATRRAGFWMRLAMFFAGLALFGQASAVALRCTAPTPPTMHTRRICHDDGQVGYEHDCVRVEIPDGQCATALGVTICVPAKAR